MPLTGNAGLGNALVTVVRTEGVGALYKGLAPTLVGIAPYAAINFASYDLLKRRYYGDGSDRRSVWLPRLTLSAQLAPLSCGSSACPKKTRKQNKRQDDLLYAVPLWGDADMA